MSRLFIKQKLHISVFLIAVYMKCFLTKAFNRIHNSTLSISPHKNADWLNEIGEELGERYGITFLHSDFKKKNGYKHSIELSKEYNLYRQNFCGCEFSRRVYEATEKMKQEAAQK